MRLPGGGGTRLESQHSGGKGRGLCEFQDIQGYKEPVKNKTKWNKKGKDSTDILAAGTL